MKQKYIVHKPKKKKTTCKNITNNSLINRRPTGRSIPISHVSQRWSNLPNYQQRMWIAVITLPIWTLVSYCLLTKVRIIFELHGTSVKNVYLFVEKELFCLIPIASALTDAIKIISLP